jgi:hypothetical protein
VIPSWDSFLCVRENILLCMNPPSQRSVILKPMSRDEARVALVIRAEEFRQLQEKMLSFRNIAPSVAVVLPVVAAIVECQSDMYQLQELVASHTRKTAWLM